MSPVECRRITSAWWSSKLWRPRPRRAIWSPVTSSKNPSKPSSDFPMVHIADWQEGMWLGLDDAALLTCCAEADLVLVSFQNLSCRRQRVYLGDRFVGADADDARESHRQAAGVAVAALEFVEGNFQDRVGLDFKITSVLTFCALEKMCGELRDLHIGQ